MTKSVALPLIGQQPSIGSAGALGGYHHAKTKLLNALLDLGQKACPVECNLREQNDMWGVTTLTTCERAGTGNPASMATHDLEDEHLG